MEVIRQETLYRDSISIREMPVNFNQADSGMFEHELKKRIPASSLYYLEDITVSPDGILLRGNKVIPVSFPEPKFLDAWEKPGNKLKFFLRNFLFKRQRRIDRKVFWITDTYSRLYFHWLTDALPRLFIIREKIGSATLLLPGAYEEVEYIKSSLKPFFIQDVEFINETFRCKNFILPAHTAPTGNYNESIIRGLRSIYTNFYQNEHDGHTGGKVYISRGKAQKRKIINEEECVAVLEEYGFKIVSFEDYSFERQVKIALNARYLISNHGAGLTNMLFMKSGGSVFELRKKGDNFNNCYFGLANALQLKYFYQVCDSENPAEDAHTANLIVDCQSLRKNIERMLAD